MGTVQLSVRPVQLVYVVNVVKSLCLISTLYPVITEPPFAGATQVMITLVPEIEVVGAAGVLGAVAYIVAPLPGGEFE
jgi:hypothetical protein